MRSEPAVASTADLGGAAAAIVGATRAVRTWTWTMRRLPLVAYLAVYLFTCYAGALALWLSDRFRTLYLLFSGATPPALTTGELLSALLLLHLAPVLLWLGFELGLRGAGRRVAPPRMDAGSTGPRWVAGSWLLLSALWAAWSLYRAGGFENLGAWLNYNAYVYARWRLFDRLGHWEFVNLYTLLPVAGAYVILTTNLTLYVLLSPLTRTSIAALAYPAVYPRWRPYHQLDVAQDMLRKIHPSLDRFGRMPDDNLVVYRILWPGHQRGSITAPYQFVLHSQGGLLVALAGSLVAGLLMALWWAPVVKHPWPTAEVSVLGALAVVLGVFLAIDSIRNSTLVSYGVVWGALPLLLLTVLSARLGKTGDREAHA